MKQIYESDQKQVAKCNFYSPPLYRGRVYKCKFCLFVRLPVNWSPFPVNWPPNEQDHITDLSFPLGVELCVNMTFFSQCIPSLWKRNLKYENICPLKYSSPNIWAVVHVIVFSLSPHVLNFYIYILYCWGGTIMCLVCTKSNRLSNIYWKWNCTQILIQICCLK